MTDRYKANFYVLLQFVLIALLFLAPRMQEPFGVLSPGLSVIGLIFFVIGAALLLMGFLRLGRSLTASPIPKNEGELVTTGLYARVRHPIYLALLVLSMGVVLDAGWWPQLIVVAMLYTLLRIKAEFEEGLLRKKYRGYKAYAEKTPRFFPRLKR
jgi:protein-S-isoprenylcysteine O-methyltransferase Ste14